MKRRERSRFLVAYAGWLFGLVAFFAPGATWNPASRFALTRALVERGSIQIDRDAISTGDRALVSGHWYSDKPPVVAFAAVPAYAAVRVAQRVRGVRPDYEVLGTESHPAIRLTPNKAFHQALYSCSLATSGLAGVALGLLLFELLRRRMPSMSAFLASALVLLGTPLYPYSTSFYSHVPAAALLLGALVCLDRRGARPEAQLSPGRLRVAGACLALAPGCEYLTAAVSALFTLWFLVVTPPAERLRAARELALGAVLPVVALGAYHARAFGAPWRTGYAFETDPTFAAGHRAGFMGLKLPTMAGLHGLSFGVRRGLFYLSPLAVVGVVFGLSHVRRRRDWVFSAGMASLALLWCLNASYYMWWGGAAAGPRHLIPALPFLAMGVALGLRARWPWVRWMTAAAALLSVANCLAVTAVGLEAPKNGDLLYDYAWKRLTEGRLASAAGAENLGMRLGLGGTLSLLPLLVWLVGGFAYLLRLLRQARRRHEPEPSSASD